MTQQFLRVQSAEGPDDAYLAPEAWVKAHPERYKVLDTTPVDPPHAAGSPTLVDPPVATSKPSRTSTKEKS